MKLFKGFLLIAFLLGVAFGYSFRLPIVFYDNPTTSASCTLGVEPGATDGLDIGVDMPAIPFTPTFDAQSVVEGAISNFRNDIRSDADTLIIWKIQFFNFTAPGVEAKWTPSMVPSDSIRNMTIAYGTIVDTSLVWVEMDEDDSLHIPAGYFCFIKLEQDLEPIIGDTIAPEITDWVPEDGDTAVPTTTTISFMATDDIQIDTTLLNSYLWVNGTNMIWFATKTPFPGGMQVVYSPILPFSAGSTITAIAQVQDLASPPNITTDTIVFTINDEPGDTDSIFTVTVQVMLTGFPPPPSMSGTKVTFSELGVWDTTEMTGSVVFDSIPGGTYNVVVTRDGYFTGGDLIPIANDTMLFFALMEDTTGGGGLAIDGTVELEGGTDFAGSFVEVISLTDSTSLSDSTDVSGYYNISGILPGLYRVVATHGGYLPDSAFAMMFFADTTIDFSLTSASVPELIVIDWDNGDTPITGGLGAAEALYDLMNDYTDSIAITAQDPDITTLNLVGVQAVVVVTGNRLGVNSMIDDASLDALRAFAEGGGNIYWEGPDAGTDYSDGSTAAQNFFYLFGVDVVDEGNSAATGNIQNLAIWTNFALCDTGAYGYRTEADHYLDVFENITSTTYGYALDGDYIGTLYPRIASNSVGGSKRCISSIYAAAISDADVRDDHVYSLIYWLLDWCDVKEANIPENFTLLSVVPNPFNASCRISAAGPVEIFDITGRLVRRLGTNPDTRTETVWDASDGAGRELPSGMYLAIVKGPDDKPIAGRRIFVVR